MVLESAVMLSPNAPDSVTEPSLWGSVLAAFPEASNAFTHVPRLKLKSTRAGYAECSSTSPAVVVNVSAAPVMVGVTTGAPPICSIAFTSAPRFE